MQRSRASSCAHHIQSHQLLQPVIHRIPGVADAPVPHAVLHIAQPSRQGHVPAVRDGVVRRAAVALADFLSQTRGVLRLPARLAYVGLDTAPQTAAPLGLITGRAVSAGDPLGVEAPHPQGGVVVHGQSVDLGGDQHSQHHPVGRCL